MLRPAAAAQRTEADAPPITVEIKVPAGPPGAGLTALIVIGCAAVGALVAYMDAAIDFFGERPAIGIAAAAVACIVIVSRGPVVCLGALVATAAAGGLVPLAGLGKAELMLGDVFYLGLAGWVLRDFVVGTLQQPRPEPAPRVQMGQGVGLACLGLGVLSLLYVQSVDPGRFEISAISFVRLVQTLSIGVFAAFVLRSRKDLLIALGGLVLGSTIAIIAALVEAIVENPSGIFTDRFEGFLGPNALGLMGGVLIVLGLFGAFGPSWRQRAALVATGILALMLGKSIGGLVGTGVAVGVGLALRSPSPPLHRATAIVLGLGVSIAIVFGMVQWLRPSATPGSPDFRESSTSQRTILGAAALELFGQHPVAGVGWRRSDAPDVIGNREIGLELRQRFQGARPDFFPDVAPTSVHNSYLQILAEFGLIGLVALVALLASVCRGMARVLRKVPRGDPLWPVAWSLVLLFVLELVYFNDTPLYGGQVETVLVALVVGCMVAVGKIVKTHERDELRLLKR